MEAFMTCGIYSITCVIDGKVYVGRSVRIESRWKSHKNALRRGDHSNAHLQRAWSLYGEESFKFEVLEECSKEETPAREAHWQQVVGIGDNDRCYNLLVEDGTGSFSLDTSTRLKMSEASLGKKKSDAHKENLARATKEYAIERGSPKKGVAVSDEQRKKISETLKGRKRAPGVTEKIQATKAAKREAGILPKPCPPCSDETRAKISDISRRMFDEYKRQGEKPAWLNDEAVAKAKETRRLRRENGEIVSPFNDPEIRKRANETRRKNRELKLASTRDQQKIVEKSEQSPCPQVEDMLYSTSQVEQLNTNENE
jgi:group I intron endonuclease